MRKFCWIIFFLSISSPSLLANIKEETSSFEAVQEVAKGNLRIQPNVAAGTIDITVYNLSNASGIRTVKLPVWTEENGQDDLFWYVANRQADGTYKVRIDKKYHKNGREAKL